MQSTLRLGFREPTVATHRSSKGDELLDCPQDHPHLQKIRGNPWVNSLKMVHGVKTTDLGDVLYLCSWQQDYMKCFYLPSWVHS